MSRWSDYGFPDLAGVPVGIALEGLYLAASERLFSWTGERLPAYDIRSIQRAVWDIEYYMRGNIDGGPMIDIRLPDLTAYSISAAASYLGEELILMPIPGSSGYAWSDPYPPISRDWMLQRYRMLNVLYTVDSFRILSYSQIHCRYGKSRDYVASTYSAAWDEVDRNFSIGTTTGLEFFCRSRCDKFPNADEGPDYICLRRVAVPLDLLYFCHVPGDIIFRYMPMALLGFEYDDFGLGLPEGEWQTTTILTPPNVAKGDTVTFPAWWTGAFSTISGIRTTKSKGFDTGFYEFFADIRKGLEFYDPIEGA